MRSEDRGPDRLVRHGRALLLGALTLLAACAAPAPAGRSVLPDAPGKDATGGVAADPEILRHYLKQLREYIDTLLVLNSTDPSEWEAARDRLRVLSPFHVFDEDPQLIRDFLAGSDEARRELGRRGVALHSITVFYQPFEKDAWNDARVALLSLGEPGRVLLTRTLVGILLNGQLQRNWAHVRYNLVETGPFALETVAAVAHEVAKLTPADAPVFRFDDLTQLIMVIIGFGDLGRPHFDVFARHAKANVRRATAKAIGEALDDSSMPELVGYLDKDPSWVVRTQAAKSMGRMKAVWKEAGKDLTARLYSEKDRTVREELLLAVGELDYYPAIPTLIRVLEIPSRRTAEKAMISLYRITGFRANRKEKWLKWYKEEYPRWIIGRQRRP